MSLPFLDKKNTVSTIMERRSKSGSRESDTEVANEHGSGDDLDNLSTDLLGAIERKSPSEISSAFRAMFAHCESEPHQEYDEDEDDGQDHDLFEMKG